jgi:hypothetical protein
MTSIMCSHIVLSLRGEEKADMEAVSKDWQVNTCNWFCLACYPFSVADQPRFTFESNLFSSPQEEKRAEIRCYGYPGKEITHFQSRF